MADYSTNLETSWGDVGEAFPAGYSYVKGEQPVDAWDNFVNRNLIKDVQYLVSLTNDRLESESGSGYPGSPEPGHLVWRTDNRRLAVYDGGSSSWRELAYYSDISNALSEHESEGVHTRPQPPEEHGDEAHSVTYAVPSDISESISEHRDNEVHSQPQPIDPQDAVDAVESHGDIETSGSFRAEGALITEGSLRIGADSSSTSSIYNTFPNGVSSRIWMGDGFIDTRIGGNTELSISAGEVEVKNDFEVGGNKDFVIDHPSDSNYDLRHGTYEGPVSGGLIYRDRVTVEGDTPTPDFPEYVLNGDFGDDWITSVTPVNHFGVAYLDTDNWEVNANEDGEYDVIVLGRRTDDKSTQGRGMITTKKDDESWEDAISRFYDGDSDVQSIENGSGDYTLEDESERHFNEY